MRLSEMIIVDFLFPASSFLFVSLLINDKRALYDFPTFLDISSFTHLSLASFISPLNAHA